MKLRRFQDVDVAGRTALVRVDYNVPLEEGKISDDERLVASLPTLEYLVDHDAKVVLISHLGRPEGRVVGELRLTPIAERLCELLGKSVRKLDDCVGREVSEAVSAGDPGDVYLLENVRFHQEEMLNDATFAKDLARLGDLFVNDAFATIHRAHASTVGVAEHLPAYAGFLVQREMTALSRLLQDPARPYIAVVGGKKAGSKLGALRDLVFRVDEVLVGGGVAFTFLAAVGERVGDSEVDEELYDEVREIRSLAEERGVRISLPVDVVAATAFSAESPSDTFEIGAIPDGWRGLDVGPKTVSLFRERILAAKTLVWTGPLGAYELAPFSAGTKRIGEAVAESSAFSVIGGGETGEAVKRFGLAGRVSYISTGGGACLAVLRGKTLPALEVLQD